MYNIAYELAMIRQHIMLALTTFMQIMMSVRLTMAVAHSHAKTLPDLTTVSVGMASR